MENLFFGSYSHSLDDKNRLVIPRKLREKVGDRLFVLKGFDGALSLYKQEGFEKLVSEINSLPFNDKASRAYARIQLASVCELELDKLGRVQLPNNLLDKYHIGREVTIIGAGDHIEIWNEDAYREYEKQVDSEFEAIAQSLSKKEE